MNLFLVTDEFNKSAMETSFRATVLAKDENSARWLVSQRSPNFQITEVAGASAFCIGEVQHTTEGVLTIVHNNGAQLLSKSQFKQPAVSTEIFYEIELLDESLKSLPNRPNTEVKWFAVKHDPKYLMRRTRLLFDTKAPGFPEDMWERNYTAQQFYLNEQTREGQRWRYAPLGEQYKSQFVDLTWASLLEIRSSILRNANALRSTPLSESVLQELWSYVRTEQVEGAKELEGLEFYPGQKLYWLDTEARQWAMTLPQITYGELYVNGDYVKDLPDTNCQTF